MVDYTWIDGLTHIGGIGISIITGFLSWAMKMKDREISEIKHTLSRIQENYVSRADFKDRFDKLEDDISSRLDKFGDKIDKLFEMAYVEKGRGKGKE